MDQLWKLKVKLNYCQNDSVAVYKLLIAKKTLRIN